ncbi:unnamed protein product [Paramecium sonneborni]|uniref:Uncharacterized protein n=1 Tax=Paramecium sonneborni TaxID=65129 RepID=A0A8S1NLL3_9CILI|nr:unnamed protein product [Paramecium sonneborni]CAD8094167.1 unnamed protein product [Paramecium sonneborni]
MRNSALGPRLTLSRAQVDDTEDIPEEPEDFETIIVEKRKIKYKAIRDDRFDGKGRLIKQGTGYGIQFDNFITVCVFDPSEEVVQIKDTLSNCTNAIDQQKINPRLDMKYKDENKGDEIILFSILKKQKNK